MFNDFGIAIAIALATMLVIWIVKNTVTPLDKKIEKAKSELRSAQYNVRNALEKRDTVPHKSLEWYDLDKRCWNCVERAQYAEDRVDALNKKRHNCTNACNCDTRPRFLEIFGHLFLPTPAIKTSKKLTYSKTVAPHEFNNCLYNNK